MLHEIRILKPTLDGLVVTEVITSATVTKKHWRNVLADEHEWNDQMIQDGVKPRNRRIVCRQCGKEAMMASRRAVFCSGKCQYKYSRRG